MEFLFEVKLKNGQVTQVRLRANIASEAVKLLTSKFPDMSGYKLLS